ncbi:MAG: hypothetical protein GX066_08590 [Clostridiaceae bacterium]|nr:hypothetical protein [Clostridiaceae bacterium]
MPWCPNCGIEYTDNYKECPRCHMDLTNEPWETDIELEKAYEEANRNRKRIIRFASLTIALIFTIFVLFNIALFLNILQLIFYQNHGNWLQIKK